jgi:rubredoxin
MRHHCLLCGFVYDETLGHDASGIAPGTSWQDVPPNWRCPDCAAPKDDFDPE